VGEATGDETARAADSAGCRASCPADTAASPNRIELAAVITGATVVDLEARDTLAGATMEVDPVKTSDHIVRVLIADDRSWSRRGLKALLSTHTGIEVVGEAENGKEALRLVEECRPDAVLMDAKMPAMDGLTATRLIKERWPGVRVVVLTMYGARRADAEAAGADAFLVKGCLTDELLGAILGR
jgi:CheY-like chemotaxis protein